MRPLHTFSDRDRDLMRARLGTVSANPYKDYSGFAGQVSALERDPALQDILGGVCEVIRSERAQGAAQVHALRNCPIDANLPQLDPDDPIGDKYRRKTSHVSEAFLALFARYTHTPLLAYSSRNRGDFITDVVALKGYEGKPTGFSGDDLVYHNDRTSHVVRADYIALLGMHCPAEDLVYTIYVDGKALLALIPPPLQQVLREPHFVTPFDALSRDQNARQQMSDKHAILEDSHCFRYRDTATTTAADAPVAAKDALIALKDALATAGKTRHRILPGDLLALANQSGLHTREQIEVQDPKQARRRWLQKTYAFRDESALQAHASRWRAGVPGLVQD